MFKLQLDGSLGMMEEPHFIKCEPEWSTDTKEFLRSESESYFLSDSLLRIKTESIHSSVPELNAGEENRGSFSETQILKEEIIKEEDDINRRNPLDDDLDLPAASTNIHQESAQDLNVNNDLKCEDESSYLYLQCDKVFRSGASLEAHMNDAHIRNGNYKCNECNRLFTWRQNLWDHIKTHRGMKSFQCTLCDKAFLRSADLRRHMVVHTGKRAFECSLCGKMFNLACNLKHHIKLHSGERPYSCSTCNMAFRSKGNLKKHVMIHTGVRPFSCAQCGKAFLEAANLKKHLRLHTKKPQ